MKLKFWVVSLLGLIYGLVQGGVLVFFSNYLRVFQFLLSTKFILITPAVIPLFLGALIYQKDDSSKKVRFMKAFVFFLLGTLGLFIYIPLMISIFGL
jgi:hypothetical protein